MSELINKHQIKIQFGTFLLVIGFIIYWIFNGAGVVYAVNNHTQRLDKLEEKFEDLATKDDLTTLKQDLKDFINKK